MLPVGIRPLREIELDANPVHRLTDATSLLEYLLVSVEPDLKAEDGSTRVDLGERVRHFDRLLTNPRDVLWALGCRNDVAPAAGLSRSRPNEEEIERATGHLLGAIREVLPAAPAAVIRDVVPEAGARAVSQPGRTRTISPGSAAHWLLLAAASIALVFGLVQFSGFVKPDLDERLRRAAAAEAEAIQREADTNNRVKLRRLVDRGQQVLAGVAALEGEIAQWQKEVLPLLSNDAGRVIATNEQYVVAVGTILDQPRASTEDTARLRTRVTELVQEPKRALTPAGRPYSPDETTAQQLELEARQVTDWLLAYQDARQSMEHMRTQATQAGANADRTLQAAIDERRSRRRAEYISTISAVAEAAREAATAGRDRRDALVAAVERVMPEGMDALSAFSAQDRAALIAAVKTDNPTSEPISTILAIPVFMRRFNDALYHRASDAAAGTTGNGINFTDRARQIGYPEGGNSVLYHLFLWATVEQSLAEVRGVHEGQRDALMVAVAHVMPEGAEVLSVFTAEDRLALLTAATRPDYRGEFKAMFNDAINRRATDRVARTTGAGIDFSLRAVEGGYSIDGGAAALRDLFYWATFEQARFEAGAP